MASVLLSAARQCAPLRTSRFAKCAAIPKQIHFSAPVRQSSAQAIADEPQTQTQPKKTAKRWILRERKFSDLLQFVADRTGRTKVVKEGQVQATAWLRLFQLATTAEDMEAIVNTFPKWRESGKSFTPLDAEMFIRRCEELECPHLAVKVFSDHPKYGFPLSSFPGARNLLHALYQKHPLQDCIAVVSLLGTNNLPPVTSDPACTAMLFAACLRSTNKNAAILRRDLRRSLIELLQQTPPFTEPEEGYIRARYSEKPHLWLLEALKNIRTMKRERNRGVSWISEWLARGEGRELPPRHERSRVTRPWEGRQTPATEAKPEALPA